MPVRRPYGGWPGAAPAIISASALNGKSGLLLAVIALPPVIRLHNRQGPTRGHPGRRHQLHQTAPSAAAASSSTSTGRCSTVSPWPIANATRPRPSAGARSWYRDSQSRTVVEGRPRASAVAPMVAPCSRRTHRFPDRLDRVQAALQSHRWEQALRPAARSTATAPYAHADHRELLAEVAPIASPPDQAAAAHDAHRAGHLAIMSVESPRSERLPDDVLKERCRNEAVRHHAALPATGGAEGVPQDVRHRLVLLAGRVFEGGRDVAGASRGEAAVEDLALVQDDGLEQTVLSDVLDELAELLTLDVQQREEGCGRVGVRGGGMRIGDGFHD